jgi:hypothetical protein
MSGSAEPLSFSNGQLISVAACLLVWLGTAAAGGAQQSSPPSSRPRLLPDRSQEDWSVLSNRALRTDPWDRVKYVPLGSGRSYLSFGGELRSSFELYRNENWGAAPQDGSGYALNRLMGHADVHIGEHVRAFAEVQSGLSFGRTGGPRPVIDQDDLDVSQLLVEYRSSRPNTARLTVRAGRQELNYGDGTLLSTRDLNVRRGFDGINVRVRAAEWRIDVFAAKPVATHKGVFDDAVDHNQTFWGVWAVTTKGLDVYYLGLARNSARFDQGAAGEHRHTLGFILREQTGGWSFAQEGDLQVGTFGSSRLVAWKIAQRTSYAFVRTRLRPVVSLQGAVSSGDADPGDPRLQTFHPLFPRGVYYGPLVFTSGSLNAIVAHPGVSLQLSPTVSFTGDTFFFWRTRTSDGLYSPSGALLRTGQTSRARYIGAAADVGVAWRADSHTTLQVVTAYYGVGAYLRHTQPAGKDVKYFSVRAAYKF